MGKKASVPNRHYTEEFKTEAVRLALSIGGNAAWHSAVDGDELGSTTSRGDVDCDGGGGNGGKASGVRVGGGERTAAPRAGQCQAGSGDRKKSGGVFREGVAVRYAWIERNRDDYAVSRMCGLLAVSRTGYLQWRHRPPSARAQANARLDAQVAAMHAASKRSYGRPRIVLALRAQGLRVGHDRVRRSLQRQALRPVYKRPYRVTTDSNHHQAGGTERPRTTVRRLGYQSRLALRHHLCQRA